MREPQHLVCKNMSFPRKPRMKMHANPELDLLRSQLFYIQ